MAVRNCAELGENLQKILQYLIGDTELKKLLYHSSKDPLAETYIPTTADVYEKLIKLTPNVTDEEGAKSIVVIKVVNGLTLNDNQEFRQIGIDIEVFVPFKQWFIKNTNLRPFAILGRIQTLLNGLTINGLGKLTGGEFELELLTDETSCYTQHYSLISYD